MIKILLVEDSAAQRRMLAKVLAANDYQVIEAKNGREGLELFRARQPDLIISDVMMPVMDGFAFLRNLRREKGGEKVPFIFYSAVFIGSKDKDLAFKLGASRFLVKPTEPKAFIEELKSLVEEYRLGKLKVSKGELKGERDYYRYYNQRIIRKLEQKVSELQREIEEHNRTEAALRASERKYRMLLEQASDAIFIISQKGRILLANKRACEILGYPKTKLLAMNIEALFPAAADSRDILLPLADLRAGRTVLKERLLRRADETTIPVEASARILDNGNIQEIVRDITERKQAEELLRDKERNVRKAYAGALSAVTGGRLLFLTADELEAKLGEPISPKLKLTSYMDLAMARAKLKELINKEMDSSQKAVDLVLAANEATTNAIKHGTKGQVRVFKLGNTLQVLITDEGPGVDFSILPEATLQRGFSTKHSLGLGFGIMLDTCERVLLATEPGDTRVLLEMPCRGAVSGKPLSKESIKETAA